MPSKKAKYRHYRQRPPSECEEGSFRTVPFHHADYRGMKFKEYHKRSKSKKLGVKAVVCRSKKVMSKRNKEKGKWVTQSILIPKKQARTGKK